MKHLLKSIFVVLISAFAYADDITLATKHDDLPGSTTLQTIREVVTDGFLDSSLTNGNSVCAGSKAKASKTNGVALGRESNANSAAVAVGYGASGAYLSSVAVGPYASATGTYAVAIGLNSKAKGSSSVAVGKSANADVGYGVAVGNAATAGNNGVSVGSAANSGVTGIAIGSGAKAGQSSIAIGGSADASKTASAAIGYGAVAPDDSTMRVKYSPDEIYIGFYTSKSLTQWIKDIAAETSERDTIRQVSIQPIDLSHGVLCTDGKTVIYPHSDGSWSTEK